MFPTESRAATAIVYTVPLTRPVIGIDDDVTSPWPHLKRSSTRTCVPPLLTEVPASSTVVTVPPPGTRNRELHVDPTAASLVVGVVVHVDAASASGSASPASS